MEWLKYAVKDELSDSLRELLFGSNCKSERFIKPVIQYVAWYIDGDARDTSLDGVKKTLCNQVSRIYAQESFNYSDMLFLALVGTQEMLLTNITGLDDFYFDNKDLVIKSNRIWEFQYPVSGNVFIALKSILGDDIPDHRLYGISMLLRHWNGDDRLTSREDLAQVVDNILYPKTVFRGDHVEQLMARIFNDSYKSSDMKYHFTFFDTTGEDKRKLHSNIEFYAEQQNFSVTIDERIALLNTGITAHIVDNRKVKDQPKWSWIFGEDINIESRMHKALLKAIGFALNDDCSGTPKDIVNYLKFTWSLKNPSVHDILAWALLCGVDVNDLPDFTKGETLTITIDDTSRKGMYRLTVYKDDECISYVARDTTAYHWIAGPRLDNCGDRLGTYGTTFFSLLSNDYSYFNMYSISSLGIMRNSLDWIKEHRQYVEPYEEFLMSALFADNDISTFDELELVNIDGYYIMSSKDYNVCSEGIYRRNGRKIISEESKTADRIYEEADRFVHKHFDINCLSDMYNAYLLTLYDVSTGLKPYGAGYDTDCQDEYHTFMTPMLNDKLVGAAEFYARAITSARDMIQDNVELSTVCMMSLSLWDTAALALYYLSKEEQLE